MEFNSNTDRRHYFIWKTHSNTKEEKCNCFSDNSNCKKCEIHEVTFFFHGSNVDQSFRDKDLTKEDLLEIITNSITQINSTVDLKEENEEILINTITLASGLLQILKSDCAEFIIWDFS